MLLVCPVALLLRLSLLPSQELLQRQKTETEVYTADNPSSSMLNFPAARSHHKKTVRTLMLASSEAHAEVSVLSLNCLGPQSVACQPQARLLAPFSRTANCMPPECAALSCVCHTAPLLATPSRHIRVIYTAPHMRGLTQ